MVCLWPYDAHTTAMLDWSFILFLKYTSLITMVTVRLLGHIYCEIGVKLFPWSILEAVASWSIPPSAHRSPFLRDNVWLGNFMDVCTVSFCESHCSSLADQIWPWMIVAVFIVPWYEPMCLHKWRAHRGPRSLLNSWGHILIIAFAQLYRTNRESKVGSWFIRAKWCS